METILSFLKSVLVKFGNYIAAAFCILIVGLFAGHSCNQPISKNTISIPTTVSANTLKTIQKTIPDAVKAVSFTPPTPSLGHTTFSTIVQKKNGDIVVVNTEKIKIGLNLTLGVYGGYNGTGNFGLKVGIFQLDRFWLDGLIGYDSLDAGISYQVLNNTFIGGGYGWSYRDFLARPIVYVGFNF